MSGIRSRNQRKRIEAEIVWGDNLIGYHAVDQVQEMILQGRIRSYETLAYRTRFLKAAKADLSNGENEHYVSIRAT